MNKILSAFLQEHNLTYDNKEKMFYGTISGMQMSGSFSVWASRCVLSFHVRLREETVNGAKQYLAGIAKTYGIQKFDIAGDGIVCVMATNAKRYVGCAQDLARYLSALELKGGCPFCDEELGADAKLVGSANGIYRAHEKCFDEYVERVKGEEAAYKAAPANIGKAIGGMVLGALVGCIVWLIFFALGFISWWSPIICGFLGAFLWDKFGGKNDKKKIISMWVITIIMLTLTMFFSYLVFFMNLASELDSSLTEILRIVMEDAEIKGELVTDLIVSYIFILAANIVVTVQIAQTQKLLSKTFRKLS